MRTQFAIVRAGSACPLFAKLALVVSLVLALAFIFSCSSSDKDDGRGSDFGGSSSSESDSVAYTLTCAAVPSTGITGITITPPTVACNGVEISSGFDWIRAPDWDNPEIGTYSGISVSASSGNCKGKSATCSGTLTLVEAPSADELTCTGMPATGFTGTAIAQPTVRCGTDIIAANGITWSDAPDWDNPAVSPYYGYYVSATANCGGSSQTSDCGTLTVSSVLSCANPASGTAWTAISAPTVTCNGTTVDQNDLDWIITIERSYPVVWNDMVTGLVPGTYSISVRVGGDCREETTCGTLTINPLPDKGNNIANYRTVKIGEQVWMAENLNYYVNDSWCYGEGHGLVCWDDDISKCMLSNAEIQANCDKYGRLYSWAAAMALPDSCKYGRYSCASQVGAKHRGICPSGWHIPNNADWDKLMHYVDGTSDNSKIFYGSYTADMNLKATSGWDSYPGESGNGTDNYGFSALPGGLGEFWDQPNGYNDHYQGVGHVGFWWSATEADKERNGDVYDGFGAYIREIYNYDNYINRYSQASYKSYKLSVRCLQD